MTPDERSAENDAWPCGPFFHAPGCDREDCAAGTHPAERVIPPAKGGDR